MFAVIRTGGKQYKVAEDDVILVERLDAEAGSSVSLPNVLMVGDGSKVRSGAPLEGVTVSATVVEQTRGPKIIVFKKKRRHNYRRKNGHRQDLTKLRITGIEAGGTASDGGIISESSAQETSTVAGLAGAGAMDMALGSADIEGAGMPIDASVADAALVSGGLEGDENAAAVAQE